jgi:hypothetical protein
MPLFDRARPVAVAPADQAAVVHAFLEKCRDWASDREIPKRLAVAAESPEAAAKLHAWVAYRAFVEHALREVEDGTLDAWFSEPDRPKSPSEGPSGGSSS